MGYFSSAQTPAPNEQAANEWRLEVFSGLHRGAQVQLEQRPWYLIGAAEDCDVVLRDPGVHPHHFLVSQDGGSWVLRALDASLQVDGKELAAGASITVSGSVLCSLGSAHLGVGQPESQAWRSMAAHAASLPVPAATAPAEAVDSLTSQFADDMDDAADGPAAMTLPTRSSATGRGTVLVGGFALLIAVTGAFGWVVHNQAQLQQRETKSSVAAIVKELGLSEIRTEADPHGHVSVQGTVATEALRSRMQKALKDAGLEPTIDVVTGERLAASVQDTFRQRGLQVDAQYAGNGKVVVAGTAASAQAEQVIRDVLAKTPSVVTIELSPPPAVSTAAQDQHDATLVPRGQTSVVASPGGAGGRDAKRVVAVIGGELPYLVTQDGSRYFTGAMLPDGSLIERVDGHLVTFLRNGNRVQVDF
jgi:type III secretion system YscD/HrpQ family protein